MVQPSDVGVHRRAEAEEVRPFKELSCLPNGTGVHPVSVRRFASFRTQPLENLTPLPMKKTYLSNPAPGENLPTGNLVMETGHRVVVPTKWNWGRTAGMTTLWGGSPKTAP